MKAIVLVLADNYREIGVLFYFTQVLTGCDLVLHTSMSLALTAGHHSYSKTHYFEYATTLDYRNHVIAEPDTSDAVEASILHTHTMRSPLTSFWVLSFSA